MLESILQSLSPDIDTLKCPKCSAIWRAKGGYILGEDRFSYYNEANGIDEELCPSGCKNFFRLPIKGKLIKHK